MERLLLIMAFSFLPVLDVFAQNNPFSPLRIWVPDSGITILNFKSAGDITGDSVADYSFLVQSEFGNPPPQEHFLRGGIPLDTTPIYKLSQGCSFSRVGDLNGDGFTDFLMAQAGQLYAFWGVPGGIDTIPDFLIYPPNINASHIDSIYFGSKVKFLGDLNDDGWPDWNVWDFRCNRIYVGPPTSIPQPQFSIFGSSLDAGDVNGDGYRDLMVGFTTYPPPFGFGGVLFYLGGPRFDTTADAVISDQDLPPDFLENIGRAVGFIGDINGDSAEEFMFLADRIIPQNRHEVFMFAGNTTVKTGVDDGGSPQIPRTFELFQNNPNPFGLSTQIGFSLKATTKPKTVQLEIYNLLGQKIRTLVDEAGKAGEKRAIWDGKDEVGWTMPSGIYFYKLSYGEETQVKKMLLVH